MDRTHCRFCTARVAGIALALALALAGASARVAAINAVDDFSEYAFTNRRMPYRAFEQLPVTTIFVAGSRIDVAFAPGEFELPQTQVQAWIGDSARAVAAYYGRFPVAHTRVLIIPVSGRGVRSGATFGYRGAATKIALGRYTRAADLKADWVMTHEFVHLGFPSMPESHHWIEEGLATYVEPFGRAQTGQLSAARVWRDLVDGLPKGLPVADDRGLDYTHTWGRTYWGGALFCLLADIEIRERTGNRRGLQDALRAIVAAGGTIEVEWPLRRVLKIGDAAVGVPVLSELYERMKAAPVTPDLTALWSRLGVTRHQDSVVFDEAAPLAAVRRAITLNATP